MNLTYRAEINPKDRSQVRLFVSCRNDVQAEALWRALRERFPYVSCRMSSFDPAFTTFFFVRTSEDMLQQAWTQIEIAIAPATTAASAAQPRLRTTHQLNDLAAWERAFRAAVRQVHDEIPCQSMAIQEVSLPWVVEQVRAGNADAVEMLLNQPTISPASALRTQIALFSETGQHERVVALVDARRREVLALPVSGRLAEQLVSAYLAFGQAHGVEDAMRGAQSLASALLPELERLHQADGVRQLLHAEQPSAAPSAPTLHEQIAGIIQLAPPDQIESLETLCRKHAGAFDLHVALGDAYASTDRTDAALEAYAQAKPNNKAEQNRLLSRRAGFLLETQAYGEVDKLLPATEDLPTDLIALRGAALYWLGRTVEAIPLLEQAWHAGERRRHLLLPIARSWAAAQQDDTAIQAYRLLLDNAPELLAAEDRARLITGLYLEGDISTMQLAQLCETYVAQGGPITRPAAEVHDILSLRVQLWAGLDAEQWRMAQSDYLEWLAAQQCTEKLTKAFDALREQSQRGYLQ